MPRLPAPSPVLVVGAGPGAATHPMRLRPAVTLSGLAPRRAATASPKEVRA